MAERFYRVLKASLKSQTEPHNWYSNLNWVLVDILSTIRENNNFSAAEMIYGTPLRLLAEYFADKATEPSAAEYVKVKQLQNFVHSLQFTPTRPAGSQTTYINKAQASCSHDFVRHDGMRSPFQRLYKGSFAVLPRSEKYFKLNMSGTIDNVSIYRLQPAYLLNAYDLSTSEMNEFSTSISPHQHNTFQTNHSFRSVNHCGGEENRQQSRDMQLTILHQNSNIIWRIVGIIQNLSIMLLTNHLLLYRFRLINHLQYLYSTNTQHIFILNGLLRTEIEESKKSKKSLMRSCVKKEK